MEFELITSNADYIAMCEMASTIWKECYKNIVSDGQIEYMLEKYLSLNAVKAQAENDGYEYYFLSDTDERVGFLALKPEKDRLFVSKVYVKKDKRKMGYGKALLSFAEKRAGQLHMRDMYLTVNKNNLNAVNVYKAYGFILTDSVVTDIGSGYVMDDYIFAKEI